MSVDQQQEQKYTDGFNGGKMFHIFDIENGQYTNEFTSEEAKLALELGDFYIKIDGSNHMIKLIKGGFYIFARYDDKKGGLTEEDFESGMFINLGPGNISSYVSDNGKKVINHKYVYRIVERVEPDDKGKAAKLVRKMYACLERATHLPIFKGMREGDQLTFEAIGTKFNKTPGCDEEVAIALHASQTVYFDEARSFEGVQKFLKENCCEGLVVDLNGKFFKIRSNLFDKKCDFEVLRGQASNLIIPVTLDEEVYMNDVHEKNAEDALQHAEQHYSQ